ncbi:hypothetical protein [Aquabacterium humicola]|uniref:hypothetical protein n=1 Tax=Aquabacterium humicola TaxID=3237377 RepID=UPI002542B327|nr:hypothetical protein [Rubrivivax pictus]
MNPRDDDDWLDALAGRPREGSAPATLQEAALLREAMRRWRPLAQAEPAADAEAALLQAAQRTGLLRRRWCPACAERWERWQRRLMSAGHPRPWAWALAAAFGIAVLLPLLRPPVTPPADDPTVLRGSTADGLQLLRDAKPRERRDALAAELAALGATVRRYERLGRFGLDAEWTSPPSPEVSVQLARRGIVRGADGSVRIEVEAAP